MSSFCSLKTMSFYYTLRSEEHTSELQSLTNLVCRLLLEKKKKPLGGSGESLIKGEITSTSQKAIELLSALAGWFNNEQDRTIAYRMLKKAEDLITDKTDILDLHFLFSSEIEIYYRHRNRDRDALNEAIKACKQQIKIAPQAASAFKKEYKDSPLPTHKGYEQLAIIEEKEKNFNSVIDLAK